MSMSEIHPKGPRITPFIAVLAMLLVYGCGFQPRGHSTAGGDMPSPVYISGIATFSDLHRELYRQLKITGAELAPVAAEGAYILHIDEVDADTRLLSVNSRNRAVEYELIESATFGLRSKAGQEMVAPQRITVLRIQYRPEQEVLGSDREAELLRQDMREELAGRIIQRLSAQYSQTR
jgi:outer membrane lipopolysaccharide assembly protein LptE/RlpB